MKNQKLSSESSFVAHADSDSILLWGTDASRHCNYFNETYCNFTGYSTNELEGDKWTNIVHPDDLEQLLKVSSEAFERRQPFALEARFRRHDNVYRWFLNVGTPVFSEDGTFKGYSGTNFDISKSKQVELAKQEEQLRLRSILEHSSTMIAQLDTKLRYVYANEPYASFWNETPDSLVGRYALSMAGSEQISNARQRFEDAAKGLSVYFEFKATRLGKPRTLLVKYVRNLDAQNELAGYYVFANDVTEIRETEKQFELILNHLPAHVAYFNRDMELQYGNRAFFDCIGRGRGEVVGRKMVDVISAQKFEYARNYIQRAFEGEPVIFEREEQGKHSIVYLVPNVDPKGRTTGVFTLELDVSPLKHAEAQLRKTDRQFELALQGSQVGFWETDLREREFFTENIESLLGLPAGKLGNQREAFYRRIHPDDIEQVRSVDRCQLDNPGSHICEYRMLMADDRYAWFRSVGESEIDSNGKYIRSAGTIANIDNLKKAQLEAAAQVRNRDIFMSVLSHELRNPLSAIRYAVDYCIESETLPEEHRTMFDIIARQTEHTSRMLSDLLDVTRVASNQMHFEKETLDLSELIRSTALATSHLFESKTQTFDVDIQPGMTTFGDGVRLQQALSNLLDNACKYSPEKSSVRLCAKIENNESLIHESKPVSNGVRAEERLVITVEDDGQGIAEAIQTDVFELFFQDQRTIHRSSGGLGLGLYLVREIVVAHGGEVTLESRGEGKGSRFTIYLHPTNREKLNRPKFSTSDHSHFTIALVEDNRDARLALTHTLTARGYNVISYSDGLQASENLPLDAPDFAIIDIGLPNKDGIQLMREMREIESLRHTVFVALTGYGQPADRRDIAAAGFETHLVKPIDVRQLLQLIFERRQKDHETSSGKLSNELQSLSNEAELAEPTRRSD